MLRKFFPAALFVVCLIFGISSNLYQASSQLRNADSDSLVVSPAPTPLPDIPAVKCDSEKANTMTKCHANYPGGCNYSQHPQYDPYLNSLKNLLINPASNPEGPVLTQADFVKLENDSFPLGLNSNNHSSKKDALQHLGEGKIRKFVGYLYYAFPSKQGEACNCNLTTDDAVDFHIGVGFSPFPLGQTILQKLRNGGNIEEQEFKDVRPALQQASAVVEITPHYRAKWKANWTIGRVQKVTGKQVMIVGQLIVDNAHSNTNDNCSFPGHDPTKCWRFSAWEIHPVTAFYVCTSNSPCSANSSAGWVKLENTPQ